MPQPQKLLLSTLLGQSKAELNQTAKGLSFRGYSTMSKAELIIALCEPPPSERAQRLIKSSSAELQEKARAEGLRGYSTLDKAGLILALAPEDPNGSGEGDAHENERVVRVYHPAERLGPSHPDGPEGIPSWAGPVIGYCWESQRAAVYTYLHVHGSVEEASRVSPTAAAVLAGLMDEPPPGAAVIDPPL